MMEIHRIDEARKDDLRLRQEPFSLPGRLIPSLQDGRWSWREELFQQPEEMCFPAETLELEQIDRDGAAFGAYLDGKCVGIAVYRNGFFAYLYLQSLSVLRDSRGQGVGKALLEAGKRYARDNGYRGIYLQAQDDNLNACRFYLHCGFEIGGFDNRIYTGSKQEGKADILFYTDI